MTFTEAQEKVKSLPSKPDNDTLLKLYSLFKQGTSGDNTEPGPSNPFDFVTKAKHEAWLEVSGKSQEEAQHEYIALVASLLAK